MINTFIAHFEENVFIFDTMEASSVYFPRTSFAIIPIRTQVTVTQSLHHYYTGLNIAAIPTMKAITGSDAGAFMFLAC